MKKSIALLLAALLVVGSLAGCTGNNNSQSGNSQSTTSQGGSTSQSTDTSVPENKPYELLEAITPDGTLHVARSSYVTYPVADASGVTLEYWLPAASNIANGAGETKDTAWAKALQEKTGITVTWTTSVLGKDDESFGTMTASQKLPDIVEWEWTNKYNGGPSAAENYGLITYLNDYVQPYGPAADLWQFLQDNPHIDKEIKDDAGHYYAFPFVRGTKYLQCTSGPLVRVDLFEAAGVDVNTLETIDDWYNALVKVKGVEGVEYPLITKNWGNLVQLLCSAFGFRSGMYVDWETEKVMYGEATEGYKNFIATIQQWLEEGLIVPNILSQDKTAQQQAIMSGTSAICYGAGGGDLGTYLAAQVARPEDYASTWKVQAINFPVANKGDVPHYGGASYDYATTSKASAAITADCTNIEIAVKFLNYNYSKEGHLIVNYGTDYTVDADGQAHYSAKTMDYAGNGFSALATSLANSGRANMSGAFAQDPNYIFEYYQNDVQKQALYNWNDHQDSQKTLIPPITMTQDESTEYAHIISDITTKVQSSYGAWYALESKVADDWDAYLSTLQGMNLETAIGYYQAALDRYNAR